jgi:hypothetical protein
VAARGAAIGIAGARSRVGRGASIAGALLVSVAVTPAAVQTAHPSRD